MRWNYFDAESLLALDHHSFDQDIPWGGWPGVGRRNGCKLAAADLIQTDIDRHTESLRPGELRMLHWQEGQMRASAGEYDQVPSLFKAAMHESPEDSWQLAWNQYAKANVVFIKRDKEALLAAYHAMLELPRPDD